MTRKQKKRLMSHAGARRDFGEAREFFSVLNSMGVRGRLKDGFEAWEDVK